MKKYKSLILREFYVMEGCLAPDLGLDYFWTRQSRNIQIWAKSDIRLPWNFSTRGRVEGSKRKKRQRLEYVKQIIDDVGCSGYCELKNSLRIGTDRELHQTSPRTAEYNNNHFHNLLHDQNYFPCRDLPKYIMPFYGWLISWKQKPNSS